LTLKLFPAGATIVTIEYINKAVLEAKNHPSLRGVAF